MAALPSDPPNSSVSSAAPQSETSEAVDSRYRRLTDNVPGVVFTRRRHPDGRIDYPFISRGLKELVGVDPAAVQGDPDLLLRLIHPQDREHFFALLAISAESGRPLEVELRLLRSDGELRWVHNRSQPYPGPGGEVLWDGVLIDVTERKRAESALYAAKDRAEAALIAKSDFIANVSHELRTRLNAIIGFSEVILNETFGAIANPRYRDYVGDIHASGLNLMQLINEIIDLSRAEVGQVALTESWVDAAAIVEASVRLVQERAWLACVDVEVNLPSDRRLPSLWADELRLKQVVTNLLLYAVKASPPGSRVRVALELAGGSELELRVADSGVGIAPDDIPRALVPFGLVQNVLNPILDGTELGLPLAKLLVELHGGTIALESRPAKGTMVSVRFPKSRLGDDPIARETGGRP